VVTSGTTSPAASRLAVRVSPATPMLVPVLETVLVPPVPVLVPVVVPVPVLVRASVLVMTPASVLARGCRGEFRGMYRVTGDRDERSPGRLGGLPKHHPACLRYSCR
jgi:hypothetical protein